jgi:hypothetical protein
MNIEFISDKPQQSRALTVKAKTKTEARELIYFDLAKDDKVTEFLDAQKPNTKKVYTSYMHRLKEFTNNESIKLMLENREQWLRRIFAYQEWLRSRKYSPNYIESNLGMLRGIFSFFRCPLALTLQERARIRKRTRTTQDYEFTSETLAKMYYSARTAKSRFIVAMAKTAGLRSEDFCSQITYGRLRALDLTQETPIFFGQVQTCKEGIAAFCFIDEDAKTAIKELLEVSRDKADNERVWNCHPKYLSPLIRRLAKRAHVDAHGQRIRFHNFRKFLVDNLLTVTSLEKMRQIVGKQTSESAYLGTQTLREAYSLVLPKIAFNQNGSIKKEVRDLKLENEALKDENERLKNQLRELTEGTKRALEDFNGRLRIQEFETARKTETEKDDERRNRAFERDT